jgi:Zn-dependent alcohol dehydrogenase
MTLPPPALTSSWIPQILMPDIARLYLAGRLQLGELVTDTFPLEAIDEAFDRSRRADGLRPVLAISDGGAFP